MSFDQSTISDVRTARDGADLLIAWQSSDPERWTHLYVDGRLVWVGIGTETAIPWPLHPVLIEVGTVDDPDALTDHSPVLPPGFPDRVTLTWTGGTYLAEDIAGFHVYASPAPGLPLDYSKAVATVPAYIGPIIDGYGVGGYGAGGYGRGASYYAWRSGHLASGVWQFDVRPFDLAGNEGDPVMAYSATIAGAPNPPAADPQGIRLRILAYNATTRVATLGWTVG